jgi:hypothetical protein
MPHALQLPEEIKTKYREVTIERHFDNNDLCYNVTDVNQCQSTLGLKTISKGEQFELLKI